MSMIGKPLSHYSLRDILGKGGPISVEESLRLALQLAEGLEAAHEKGVIQWDLKPANVMIASL
jgi:serine/threonine protein kinase